MFLLLFGRPINSLIKMGQTFSSQDRSNNDNDNYYTYISYAIFALIFVTAFFWVQSIKLIFNKIFVVESQDVNNQTSSSDSLIFDNSNKQSNWKAVLVDLAFSIVLTVITIILIIIFHPSLSEDNGQDNNEKGAKHMKPPIEASI